MPSQPEKKIEMWLPTSETKVTVIDGQVRIWDEMTMEKRVLRKPAGFARKEKEDD